MMGVCVIAAGVKVIMPFLFAQMSEICMSTEQQQEGLEVLKEAQKMVDKTGERYWDAELHRLKGELLFSQLTGNQSDAESCFNQALEVARSQKAKSLELRAAMSLSRLWQRQGKKEEARSLLSEIYNWFT